MISLIIIAAFSFFIFCMIFFKTSLIEGFEGADTLSAVSILTEKINSFVNETTDSYVDLHANLRISNAWTGSTSISDGNAEISNDTEKFNKLMVVGNKSGETGKREVGIWDNLTVAQNLSVGGEASIDGEQITKEMIQKMKSHMELAGYAVDGQGTTHLLFANGMQNLTVGSMMDAWANDAWDIVYLFKGWKGTFYAHPDGEGTSQTFTNSKSTVESYILDTIKNQASSYEIAWVGY